MNRIKLFIMDVDGTLTDGKIYMGNDGEVMKAFSAKDGYGITQIVSAVFFLAVVYLTSMNYRTKLLPR